MEYKFLTNFEKRRLDEYKICLKAAEISEDKYKFDKAYNAGGECMEDHLALFFEKDFYENNKIQMELFLQIHSDFLQILVEQYRMKGFNINLNFWDEEIVKNLTLDTPIEKLQEYCK